MVEKKDVCAWIHDVIRGKFRRWGDKLSVGDDAVKDLINEIFQALCLRYYSPINGGTLRRFIRETARGLGKASITAASQQLSAKEIAAAEYAERISEQKDAAGEHHQLPPAALPTLTPYVGQLVDRDGAEVYPAWQIAKDTGVHIRAVYRWMNAHGCGMVDGVRVLTTAQRQAFEAEQRDKQILKELQALAQEKGFTEDAARKKVQRLREQGHSFEKIFKDLRSSRPRPYRKRTPPHGETK
jgi:hypothetical protein